MHLVLPTEIDMKAVTTLTWEPRPGTDHSLLRARADNLLSLVTGTPGRGLGSTSVITVAVAASDQAGCCNTVLFPQLTCQSPSFPTLTSDRGFMTLLPSFASPAVTGATTLVRALQSLQAAGRKVRTCQNISSMKHHLGLENRLYFYFKIKSESKYRH